MEGAIKVSGCIVTHNNDKYIEKTIRTVLDNTKGVDFKLYIVDNDSTDETLSIVKSLLGEYQNLELIETHENIGFGAGHNYILNKLDSDYHCVINPDIIIDTDIITNMSNYIRNNPDVVMISPRICFPDGRNQILGKKNPRFKYLVASRMRNEENPSKLLSEYAMLDEDYTKPFEIENATGCFMFFRTKKFLFVGGFDERYFMYFEDCDITRQMKTLGKVLYYPDAIVYHVWARDSKRNTKLKLIHIQSMFKYFIKWRTF